MVTLGAHIYNSQFYNIIKKAKVTVTSKSLCFFNEFLATWRPVNHCTSKVQSDVLFGTQVLPRFSQMYPDFILNTT